MYYLLYLVSRFKSKNCLQLITYLSLKSLNWPNIQHVFGRQGKGSKCFLAGDYNLQWVWCSFFEHARGVNKGGSLESWTWAGSSGNDVRPRYRDGILCIVWKHLTKLHPQHFNQQLPFSRLKCLLHCKRKENKREQMYHTKTSQLTPTHSPSGLRQRAERRWRQQPGHRVVCAVLGAQAPQTLKIQKYLEGSVLHKNTHA